LSPRCSGAGRSPLRCLGKELPLLPGSPHGLTLSHCLGSISRGPDDARSEGDGSDDRSTGSIEFAVASPQSEQQHRVEVLVTPSIRGRAGPRDRRPDFLASLTATNQRNDTLLEGGALKLAADTLDRSTPRLPESKRNLL